MRAPDASEYDPFYETYVSKVPPGEVMAVLAAAPAALREVADRVPEDAEDFAYAPDKWTIRELVGHVNDTERLFSFRALHMARADPAPLPGMDHMVWAGASNAAARPLDDLVAEFAALRDANVRLFRTFDDAILARTGVASGSPVSVRALVHITAGHALHHLQVLEERYLPAL